MLYIFRAVAFIGFATILFLATLRYVRHKRHQPCRVSQWPHTYQLILCIVLLLNLVPAFIVGEPVVASAALNLHVEPATAGFVQLRAAAARGLTQSLSDAPCLQS